LGTRLIGNGTAFHPFGQGKMVDNSLILFFGKGGGIAFYCPSVRADKTKNK